MLISAIRSSTPITLTIHLNFLITTKMKPTAKKNLIKWLTYILTAVLGALGGNQIPL